MLAGIRSGTLRGIDAIVVEVEVDVSNGLPQTTTVGLPDGAVREGRDRIRAALRNSGFAYPARRVTVNLAPAGVRKEGAAFDLPIALALLAASGNPPLPDLAAWCVLGELGLDGRVHPVRGALPVAAAARRAGACGLVVPHANAAEAALAGGPPVFGVHTLGEAVAHLRGEVALAAVAVDLDALVARAVRGSGDFAEVHGQQHAKRALEIAAAGQHNVLLIGAVTNRSATPCKCLLGRALMRDQHAPEDMAEGEAGPVTIDSAPSPGTLRVARHRARKAGRNEGRQPTHGMHALDRTLRTLGSRALDGRSAVSKQLAAWRADLVRDMGSDPSTAEAALIDVCVRQRLLLESVDAWLLTQQLVDEKRRELIPVLRQRQALADGLCRYLSMLGLQRKAKVAEVNAILDRLRGGSTGGA